VLIQNLAPGAAARLGLDAAGALARHPRLIACDVSGYGTGGPYSGKKAYDLLVQCETGFLSINGSEDQMAKCGLAIADIAAGMYVLQAILMGLVQRGRTGLGMAVEVSLFDALTEWMSYPAMYAEGSGRAPRRTGPYHATIAPYGPFACGDGRQCSCRCKATGNGSCSAGTSSGPDLGADPRFRTNPDRHRRRDELRRMIERRFAALSAAEALALLEGAGIANAKLNTVEDFLNHEQLVARGRSVAVGSPTGPGAELPARGQHRGPRPQ
jgi:crotonobetainyl-CoA:carnitine CoA-transferase CaiB-like acyl-CoA transferase